MAFDLPNDQDAPKFTVVSAYGVSRLGRAPSATVALSEVAYSFTAQATVDSTEDLDGDGLHEVLHIGGFGNLSAAGLVGKPLALPDSTDLGLVAAATSVVVTPAQTDASGAVLTPAVLSMTLTMGTPSPADLAGQTIGLVLTNSFGGPVYRHPTRGREWTLCLNGSNPADFARMQQAMGTILATALTEGLRVMEIEATPERIQDAVVALAGQGITIDSIWSDVAQQIELARRAGTYVPSTIMGSIPR